MSENKQSEKLVSNIAEGLHLSMATETIFRTLCWLSKIEPGSVNFEVHMVYLRDYIDFILDEDSSEHLKWSFLSFVNFSEAEYYYDLFSLIIKGINPFCAKLITTFRDEVLSANNFYGFKEGLKGLRDLLNNTECPSDSIKGFYQHTEDPNRIVYVYGMYFCDEEKQRFCLYLDPSTGDCSAPEEAFLKRFSKVEVEGSNYNDPINRTLHVKRKLDLNDSSNNKVKDLHLTNREIHLAFDNLSDVYSFLTDAVWHVEYNDDGINMEDFIDLYRDTTGTEDLVYDSDGVKDWGASLQSLQFAKIYFEKPCRYYLALRGVENVEDFKNG